MNAVQRAVLWALALAERYRFIKFIVVGGSGTVLNIVLVYIGHEYIFNSIESSYQRPYISQAIAISLSTVNNFTWNRLWTWSDRVRMLEADEHVPLPSLRLIGLEFGQYATASAFGSGLQYVLAMLLAGSMHYILATLTAIAAVSVTNYLSFDRWVFKRSKD